MNILPGSRRGRLTAAIAGTLFLAASAQVAVATTEPPTDTTDAMAEGDAMAESTDAMAEGDAMTEDSGAMAEEAPPFEIPTGISGEIAISGSSTVEPISSAAATAFAAVNPGVAISVDGPGTGDGFARFCADEIDIADASRPIRGSEVETCEASGVEFIELTVAVDGISVITSVANTEVECLSFVDLYALLGPDAVGIGNWAEASEAADELAGTVTDLGAVNTPYPDVPLIVTAPGEESGTFDTFVEIVIESVGEAAGVEDALPRVDYTASANDNVIIEAVGANPGALGWVGFAFVEENLDVVKPLAVDGGDGCIEPTPETIASSEFPIARDLFIYVNSARLEANPALEAFADYYVNGAINEVVGTGEGQVPYVQVSDEVAAATQQVWADRETGTRAGGE